MADFFNEWWGIGIAIIVAISMAFCVALLWSQSKVKVKVGADGKPLPAETTGHVWDGNLMEQNNPLPKWWQWLFYLTVVFSIGYLVVYPGFGTRQGTFGWSQIGAYEKEMKDGEAQYGPIFNKYLSMDIKDVAKDPQAREIGQRLFLNTCAQCHGSDAQGGKGYPNLTDKIWLYGGGIDTVMETINKGRNNQMPAHKNILSPGKIHLLAAYVWGLSNNAEAGKVSDAETQAIKQIASAVVPAVETSAK